MKFAIVETGGKQVKVTEGVSITIEKLDVADGGKVTFDKVLLVDDGTTTTVGAPYVKGASVEGELVATTKGTKIYVSKFKNKTGYNKRIGHRQLHSTVKVSKIK
jgi:large subunit ribosomal protein L21